jgi:rSAM/selenodomain-associated transferase 1
MPWWNGRVGVIVDNPVDKVDNSVNSYIFSHNGVVIGLFAKQPVPGQVKTRLTPPLTAEQACQLYDVVLRETVAQLRTAGLPLVICYAGQREWFRATFPGLPLLAQSGEDLGARMRHAVNALFAAGAGPVLLAGSDSPDLPIPLLRQAVERLHDQDVAVIPCQDGGYALVGMRRPTTELFEGIPWSSAQVLTATRQRSRELGLTLHETATWHDLDELADLRRLVARAPESQTAHHILTTLHELF